MSHLLIELTIELTSRCIKNSLNNIYKYLIINTLNTI